MNILRRELREGLKPFLFWSLGLFILVFTGMLKFTGIKGTEDISGLINKFPKIVQSIMGMVGVDINTLGGYYSLIAYFALISAAIYSIYLGTNAVTRETVDKTYEFVFTKPRTRSYILRMKLSAAWINLTLFCILEYIFSITAQSFLSLTDNIDLEILLFTLSIFLVSSIFLSLAALISTLVKYVEKGALYGNLCFLFAFIMGILYDILENASILKFISPFKYFDPVDLMAGRIDLLFLVICVILTAIFLYFTFTRFKKKDLTAV